MSSGTGGSEGETVPVLDQADEEGEVKKESQATPWFRLLTRPPTLQRSLSCTRSRDTIGRRASTSFSAAAPQLVRLTCRAPLKQATCPSPWRTPSKFRTTTVRKVIVGICTHGTFGVAKSMMLVTRLPACWVPFCPAWSKAMMVMMMAMLLAIVWTISAQRFFGEVSALGQASLWFRFTKPGHVSFAGYGP